MVKKELTIQVLIIPLGTDGTELCSKQHDEESGSEESGGSHRGKLKAVKCDEWRSGDFERCIDMDQEFKAY